jgi:putative sterol carrier protein
MKNSRGRVYTTKMHEAVNPDVTLKMTRKTFDDITEKNISKFRAVCTGKISVNGSLTTLKAFNSKIVD